MPWIINLIRFMSILGHQEFFSAYKQSLIFNPDFFSAGISTSFADWPRFCYKNTSSLRWKSQHSIELKTEVWKQTEQNFFSRYTTYITIYSAYMILRSIWTVFKNAILHTNEVSKISPATKSLFCSDFLPDFVETY